jgi:hypothetical protein
MRTISGVLCLALFLGGCATEDRTLQPDGKTSLNVPHTFVYSYDTAASANQAFFLTAYANAKDRRAEVRNQILFELMGIIDDEFGRFERALSGTTRTKNFAVSSASMSLTGVATFATGSAAKILAAVDTGLKGINGAVDKDLLAGKASEALIYQMRANRSKVQSAIYGQMAKTDAEYPLEAGIHDLVEYFNEGSVTVALASLTQTVATQASTAASAAAAAKVNLVMPAPRSASSPTH